MLQTQKPKESLYAVVGFTLFWLGILTISGSLFSGYHFMDDSIILNYRVIIKEKGLWNAIMQYLEIDMKVRLRPVWVVEFITGIYIKGDNFVVWSVARGICMALTNVFLFLFARRTGLGRSESIVFSLLVLLGQQASLSGMLGPAEVPGIFFLALSLYLMARTVETGSVWYTTAYIFSAVCMSLSKEAFVFFVPPMFLWQVWLYAQKYNTGFWKAVQKNAITCAILVAVVLAELAFLYQLPKNMGGYSGVDEHIDITKYVLTFISFLVFSIIGLIALAGFVVMSKYRQAWKWEKLAYPLALFFLVVFPQVITYTKSGFYERYFLPGVVGIVALLFHQLSILKSDQKTYTVGSNVLYLLGILSLLVSAAGLAIFFSEDMRVLLVSALRSFRGEALNSMNPEHVVLNKTREAVKTMGIGVALMGLCMTGSILFLVKSKIRTFRLYHVLWCMMLVGLLVNLVLSYGWIKKFTMAGNNANAFLSAIVSHTAAQDPLLLVGDPWVQMEPSTLAVPMYLKHKTNIRNVYALPLFMDPANATPQNKQLLTAQFHAFEGENIPFKCIAIFPEIEPLFLQSYGSIIKENKYTRADLGGGYVVYYRP